MKADMIKAVIVEDEPLVAELLANLLRIHCPQVELLAGFRDPRQALEHIPLLKPGLVFLDVEMPHMNGFELLEKLGPLSFEVIFTTGYDQYAIRAIRFSALDYLMKPIDPLELVAAVKKYESKTTQALPQQFDILFAKLHQKQQPSDRIAIPTLDGLQIIPVNNIIYCSSSSNYTIFTLQEKQKLTVSRTLKDIEEMLAEHHFLRVHHSYLVNLDHVKKYIRGEGGSLLMSDGSSVDVSRARKDTLLEKLTQR
jgi:two-component system LytT family response regulator